MDTKTNGSVVGICFGEEVFANAWIVVIDQLGQDVQVMIEDLLEVPPGDDPHRYTKVFYDGKEWWIHESNYFPI